MQHCVKDLNHLYKNEPALYEYQFDPKGFEWIELDKRKEGVMMYKRKGKSREDDLLIVLNISTQNFIRWQIPVKGKNHWQEVFNSNSVNYWGTGENLNENLKLISVDKKKKLCEIIIDIPALTAMIFR